MDVWAGVWEVGNREAPDRRIWRVRYGLVAENVDLGLPTTRPLATIITELRQALSDLVAFCDQLQIQGFGERFRKAEECLSADNPLVLVHHKDLAPEKLLSLSAQQLLAASQAAWVFGGMGSWNDMGFEGREQGRYEKLSDSLFSLLNEAIPASVNSAA